MDKTENKCSLWDDEDEIDVTVSITLSKRLKLKVDDYAREEEADGDFTYMAHDYTDCDLEKALNEQYTLPQDIALFIKRIFNYDLDLKASGMPKCMKNALEDCSNWDVDDLAIVRE